MAGEDSIIKAYITGGTRHQQDCPCGRILRAASNRRTIADAGQTMELLRDVLPTTRGMVAQTVVSDLVS